MTQQTELSKSLGGSPAGLLMTWLSTVVLAAMTFVLGGALAGFAQAPPDAAKPAKPVAAKKAPAEPAAKMMGHYMMHSSIELGGNLTQKSGSNAMWATMVNEGTGMRVVGQSLELHSVDTSKTPFFDNLSTSSMGYGGEPYDVSYLKFSKGHLYDFNGSFRRDRNYFDYNLLDNSLLSTATVANPVLITEPDSLHIFNTVRRNTDTMLTLFPISRVSFRAGFNHGTHEGPTYSSIHGGGDVQVLQWFRNGLDTYTGGVDVKLVKRTSLSYDQFYALYKGDSPYQLAPTPFTLANGTPSSLGVNTLSGTTCGTGASKTNEVVNGIVNPFCSQTLVQSQVAPTRTVFPTEQLRFSSHYWERIAMNGRFTYSGGISNVNHFNETFDGLLARTFLRREVDTGGLGNGRLAHNKRVNVNADYGVEAELNNYVSITDSFTYWDFRLPSSTSMVTETWADTGTPPPVPTSSLNVNTPITSLVDSVATTPNSGYLAQKNIGNTVLGIITVTPEVKLSAGWRFNNRQIKLDDDDPLNWHQNGLLLGAVVQPSRSVRVNLNFDTMDSKAADSATPINTYTREANNRTYHLKARALVKPNKWFNFAMAANDFNGKNDDVLVNHVEHSHDFSFSTQVNPTETLSLDFDVAHDDVFSQTDLCYVFLPTASVPLPPGATNAGTCVPTADNNTATSNLFLGRGYYDAPSTFFSGVLSYAPSHYFRFNGGARFTELNGKAELLNPLMAPGALLSKTVSPFADLAVNIAPQWSWHGNWIHHGYGEGGGPGGTAPRNFHGDVVTLSVKYAF
jgi:hypothetical protein